MTFSFAGKTYHIIKFHEQTNEAGKKMTVTIFRDSARHLVQYEGNPKMYFCTLEKCRKLWKKFN